MECVARYHEHRRAILQHRSTEPRPTGPLTDDVGRRSSRYPGEAGTDQLSQAQQPERQDIASERQSQAITHRNPSADPDLNS